MILPILGDMRGFIVNIAFISLLLVMVAAG